MIGITDQISLQKAIEQIKPSAKFLVDTFFPNHEPVLTSDYITVEWRRSGRSLAPYIIEGTRGVNIGRNQSKITVYRPPMVGVRRNISINDIKQRDFGEQFLYTQFTPEQRAARIQARDMVDLQNMIENRKNKMASDILRTGQIVISSYADDNDIPRDEPIEFDWTGKLNVAIPWTDNTADIYSDIYTASEKIQEDTGEIPTIMIVGKNVPNYLINNKRIKEWLSIPNRENFALMSLQPRLESTQILRVGYIQSLNLEVYVYNETYTDESGHLRRFIGDNDVIIANPRKGSQIYGSITLMNREGTDFDTYAAEVVPYYRGDPDAQTLSLTLYSRFLLVPDVVDSWVYMNVGTGESNTLLPSV